MCFRIRKQLAEVVGPENRLYCSQAYGYRIDDPETLLIYFIRSGGAADFALRFEQAMGPMNRWYCSEFYGRDIQDPEILWDYYMVYGRTSLSRNERSHAMCDARLVAC